jgi:hypothetical protein
MLHCGPSFNFFLYLHSPNRIELPFFTIAMGTGRSSCSVCVVCMRPPSRPPILSPATAGRVLLSHAPLHRGNLAVPEIGQYEANLQSHSYEQGVCHCNTSIENDLLRLTQFIPSPLNRTSLQLD